MGERKKGDETEAKIGERREPEQAAQAIINLACNSTMHTISLCNRCNLMVNVLSVFTVCLLYSGILREKESVPDILVPENFLYSIIPPAIFQFQNAIIRLSYTIINTTSPN